MKIVKPNLRKNLNNVELDYTMINEDLIDLEIINQVIDFKIDNICFNGCKFINVDFSRYPLKKVSLIDCIFEKCNLSGSDFSNTSIYRCTFEECNLLGSNFIMSGIIDVSIIDSKCDYINFSDSKFKHFLLKNSSVKEGRVVHSILDDVSFENVNFNESEFLNTKLGGIDFSSCNINNIGITTNDIKGVIVSEEQALMLINLFGIVVK